MKDYKILSSYSIHTFQNDVNYHLNAGYVLCGGPFIDISYKTVDGDCNNYSVTEVRKTIKNYCQAVYKEGV